MISNPYFRNICPLFLLTFFLTSSSDAQMYVQLEKAGTLRTIRYAPGDILTFRLVNDDKGWYDRMIDRIDIPGNRIVFTDVIVHVDSIDAIRIDKKAVGAQIIGSAMQVGGINTMLFVSYDAIFRDEERDPRRGLDWVAMLSGVANIAVGTAIKRIFDKKVFQPGPNKRIRLLDLNFAPIPKR